MEHKNIKLIAFDLDGTLFNDKKEVTLYTLKTLERAVSMGIEIVPVTGRLLPAIPENVKSMNFIRYVVTMNGADIIDIKNSKSLKRFEIPPERAALMIKVFSEIPDIIYDSIIDGRGYMEKEQYENIPDFMIGEWQTELVRSFRSPVEGISLSDFILKKNSGIQKMQIYTLNKTLRENLLKSLPVVFQKSLFTSSIENNIEINDLLANKGEGLRYIAEYLNIPIENTISFGDGLNDFGLIKAAGVGVAMGNAIDELKAEADYVTCSNEDDGVAKGIEKFCF